MKREYKYIATSRDGFIQQIVCYVRHGYVHYVKGVVKNGKEPAAIDEKLLGLYGIRQTDGQRFRRKERGLANFQYIRFGREWVMMATHGEKKEFHTVYRLRTGPGPDTGLSWNGSARCLALNWQRMADAAETGIRVHAPDGDP